MVLKVYFLDSMGNWTRYDSWKSIVVRKTSRKALRTNTRHEHYQLMRYQIDNRTVNQWHAHPNLVPGQHHSSNKGQQAKTDSAVQVRQNLDGEQFEKFMIMCWGIWSHRNKVLHGVNVGDPATEVEAIFRFLCV
ncbi:hypothetical protein OROHE_014049 [Orobanche hederae]